MGYYPVFLDVGQRRCVVIGGGAIAQRRVDGLLVAGANVTVISPAITEGLRDLLEQGAIRHVTREYRAGDRAGYDLVFVATDNPQTNAAVADEAQSLRIWVNSADDPDHCDFILPAVIRRGDLAVAVSTGGVSPAATRAIREELEKYLTADYVEFVRVAGEVRKELRDRSVAPAAAAWNRALQGDFRRLIKDGKSAQAKKHLLETLEAK